jgi:hypothetical protein
MSFIRRFFIGIAEWLAFLFVLFGTLVGAAAGRENGDYLGGKFGIPSGLRDAFGMLVGAAVGFAIATVLAAVLLSLIETASNTRQIMLLLRRQEADRRAMGLRGTQVQR